MRPATHETKRNGIKYGRPPCCAQQYRQLAVLVTKDEGRGPESAPAVSSSASHSRQDKSDKPALPFETDETKHTKKIKQRSTRCQPASQLAASSGTSCQQRHQSGIQIKDHRGDLDPIHPEANHRLSTPSRKLRHRPCPLSTPSLARLTAPLLVGPQ